MGKLYALLAQVLVIRGVPDAQCGLKVYRGALGRELFAISKESGVLFDTEILALAAQRRARISQRPALWRHDPDSRLHFGLVASIGVAFALVRLKLRHRILLAVRATGPVKVLRAITCRSPSHTGIRNQGMTGGSTRRRR